MSEAGRDYVFGISQRELERLALQYQIGSAHAHQLWESARVQPGAVVVDAGCGPGHAALDLAQIVGPAGRVIGVDAARLFCDHLRAEAAARRLVQLTVLEGDVHDLEAAGVPPGTADVVVARFVLSHAASPERALRSLRRALKAGGRLVVTDVLDFAQMHLVPPRVPISRVIAEFVRIWRERRGSPDVMRHLPALLTPCGFTLLDIQPQWRAARPGTLAWHWPDSFFRHCVPDLLERQVLDAATVEAFTEEWAEATREPGSVMYNPPLVSLIAAAGG